jgi:hypothetical protein
MTARSPGGQPVSSPLPPKSARCESCGVALTQPFGWCSGCHTAFCFACGRVHFCTPQCEANGCLAGLCVRVFEGGVIDDRWGLPADNPASPGEA